MPTDDVTVPGPAVPGEAWVQRRRDYVAKFLADRALDFHRLTDFLRERVGDGQVMLTSSPVQGLSNATSDLDFIRIQQTPIEGARISTKIFDQGHHLEIVSFAAAELTRNLDELALLATADPATTVAGYRGWDKRLEPRRKQTERIVGGITADGEMPYVKHLPALAVVWSRAALHTALEQLNHLSLAEAAGERRGRLGYAFTTILHLADALLSHTGDVYTTRKWFLLRWSRASPATSAEDPRVREAAGALDRLRVEVASHLRGDSGPLTPRYAQACRDVARIVAGTGQVELATAVREDVTHRRFLAGSGLLVGPAASVVVPGDAAPPAHTVSLTGLATGPATGSSPGPAHATALLRATRAGLAETRIAYLQNGIR